MVRLSSHLDGKVKLKILLKTQQANSSVCVVKGKALRSGYAGDLICRVVIETPVNPNKEQKELLEKLEESLKGTKVDCPRNLQAFRTV